MEREQAVWPRLGGGQRPVPTPTPRHAHGMGEGWHRVREGSWVFCLPALPQPLAGHFHTGRAAPAALLRQLFPAFNLTFLRYNLSPFDILSATSRENRLFPSLS